MADEEALRKIRSVEEQIDILNKKLSIAKQVRELLASFVCFPRSTASLGFVLRRSFHLRRRRTRC